jgi:dTDP-4-dehydrorhamnose reductase
MARILILGGSGLLGRALQRRKRAGDEVSFTHHRNTLAGSLAFDLRSTFKMPEGNWDVVICSMPVAKILIEADKPRERARDLFDSFGAARPVLLSTDAVFSGRHGNYREDSPTDPITDYGRAQATLDEAFLVQCPAGLVVRTSFLFGGRAPHFDKRLGPLLDGAVSSAEQRWPENIFRSPTEVDFCAEAIWRCIEHGRHGIINVCGERMSIRQFFATALSVRGTFTLPPPYVETRSDVAVDTSLDPRMMEAQLGVSRAMGWAWYRQPPA